MKRSYLLTVSILIVVLCLSGCSFSTSSKHSSKSSSSPSRSSSGTAEKKTAKKVESYREDVITLTILYTGSKDSSSDFQRELGQISNRHGIVDWENNPGTFEAIGIGLNRAGVPKSSVETIAFIQGLTHSRYYREILDSYN